MAPYSSPTKKARVVALRNKGFTNAEIQEEIPLSKRQLGRIYEKYREKENFYNVGPKSGRPRKLNPRDVRAATRHLANCTAHDAADLQPQFFPDVSVWTLKRRLRETGLNAHIRRNVPLISRGNLKKRLKWAEEHQAWTVEDWNSVMFSDESIFCVFGTDGIQWCWRRPGERLDPRFTKKKVKHGGGNVTVWAVITPDEPGRIVRIEGNMDKFLYCEILQDDLLGTFDDLDMDPCNFIFQQDNNPKHTSGIARAWFEKNHVTVLRWPPSSPDMNIIEHIWDYLDRQILKHNPPPYNEEQLRQALREEWDRMDVEFLRKLYASMPLRVRAVIDSKGGSTRY